MTDAQNGAMATAAESHAEIREALREGLEVLNFTAGEGLVCQVDGREIDAMDCYLDLCSAIAFDHDAVPEVLAHGIVDCIDASILGAAEGERAAIVSFVRGLSECDDEQLSADLDFGEIAARIERQDHHCQCMEVYGENPACPVKHETDGVEYGA